MADTSIFHRHLHYQYVMITDPLYSLIEGDRNNTDSNTIVDHGLRTTLLTWLHVKLLDLSILLLDLSKLLLDLSKLLLDLSKLLLDLRKFIFCIRQSSKDLLYFFRCEDQGRRLLELDQ
jgi:hypothetical protein